MVIVGNLKNCTTVQTNELWPNLYTSRKYVTLNAFIQLKNVNGEKLTN